MFFAKRSGNVAIETTSSGIDKEQLAAVAHRLGLRLVVLYGSHATHRPEPSPESDVDIAVLGCQADKFWECYKALSEALGSLPLDMVRIEDADALFRQEIMRAAILLYGDPDLFYEYRAYAYRDFVDSADLFALEEALFQKKMAHIKECLHGSP